MTAAVHTWLGIVIGPLISELLRLSRDHEFPAFESSWGGLGRGLGGWSVNRMMLIGVFTLLVLLLFGSVTLVLLTNGAETDKNAGCGSEGKTKPAAAATANSDSTKAADAVSGAGKNPQVTGKE
jgi:hypothetical protein